MNNIDKAVGFSERGPCDIVREDILRVSFLHQMWEGNAVYILENFYTSILSDLYYLELDK